MRFEKTFRRLSFLASDVLFLPTFFVVILCFCSSRFCLCLFLFHYLLSLVSWCILHQDQVLQLAATHLQVSGRLLCRVLRIKKAIAVWVKDAARVFYSSSEINTDAKFAGNLSTTPSLDVVTSMMMMEECSAPQDTGALSKCQVKLPRLLLILRRNMWTWPIVHPPTSLRPS